MKHKILSACKVLCVSSVAMMCASAPGYAETFKLTFASGFPPVIGSTATIINAFLPGVNAELEAMGSEHRVDWNVAVSGSLAGLPAILDVTRDGIADVAELGVTFEPNRLPLTNIGYIAPFATSDHKVATLAVDSLIRTMPAMQQEWEQHGLVYLAGFAIEKYVLMSKNPVDSLDDLRGQKVGVAGININWLDGTGAVGVLTAFGTAYNDLKTGVVESVIVPMIGGTGIKLYEVAPYATRVEFGSMFQGGIVVNKARWDSFPDDVRTAMTKSAAAFQEQYFKNVDGALKKAEEAYVAGGGTFVDLPAEERQKWAGNLKGFPAKWAKPLEDRGLPAREVLSRFMDYQRAHSETVLVDWDKVSAN